MTRTAHCVLRLRGGGISADSPGRCPQVERQDHRTVFTSAAADRRTSTRCATLKTASLKPTGCRAAACNGCSPRRANSRIARLYSLAVAPKHTGRGIASALIAAAEKAARSCKCRLLRLEVHERNHGAIKVYCKAGYREFGRHHQYYQDRGHALRFEKVLARS
jgi:ribosomal protein S18 acetylase RimI-like enzyme